MRLVLVEFRSASAESSWRKKKKKKEKSLVKCKSADMYVGQPNKKTRRGWLCKCDAVVWLVMAGVGSTWALLDRVRFPSHTIVVARLLMLSLHHCVTIPNYTHIAYAPCISSLQVQQLYLKHFSGHCCLCQYFTWWLVNSDFAGKHVPGLFVVFVGTVQVYWSGDLATIEGYNVCVKPYMAKYNAQVLTTITNHPTASHL